MEMRVPKPLVRELRAKLRDYPEVNYIDKKEESRDKDLARCLWEAMEDLNLIPPVFDDEYSFESLPKRAVRIILDLALVRVLNEVSIWMIRQDFKYIAGDVQVDLYSRWRSYQQLIPQLSAEAKATAQGFKFKENTDRAWGASLTEMYSGWRGLSDADWYTVNV